MLTITQKRFILFPIQNRAIWDMYKKSIANLWTAGSIDTTSDMQYVNVTNQKAILFVLCCIVKSQQFLHDMRELCSRVQLAEARCFYGTQIQSGNVHLELCSKYLEQFPESLVNMMFNVLDTQVVYKNASMQSDDFLKQLVYSTIKQCIFMRGCFALYESLNAPLPGLEIAMQRIMRDNELHVQFGLLMCNQQPSRMATDQVNRCINKCVDIESLFVKSIIADLSEQIEARGLKLQQEFALAYKAQGTSRSQKLSTKFSTDADF